VSTPTTETYVGPCSLAQALDASEPHRSTGIRLAISSPDGDYVALQHRGGKIRIRKLDATSGHAGSRVGTGRWLKPEECHIGQWRPG
jgi:hypothetical protein